MIDYDRWKLQGPDDGPEEDPAEREPGRADHDHDRDRDDALTEQD